MISEAVILAAGLGLRMWGYSKGKPKFAIEVLGKPLLWYPLSVLVSAGVSKVTAVVPGGWRERLLEVVGKFEGVEFAVVECHTPSRDNGYTLLFAEDYVSSGRFFLSMCDHVYVRELLFKLASGADPEVDLVVAADGDPKYVDVAEATKILADADGNILAIDKELERFNYVDAGVFVLSRRIFDVARTLKRAKWVVRMSEVVAEAVKRGHRAKVADVTGAAWTEVDTPDDIEALVRGDRKPVMEAVLRELGAEELWGK